MTNEEKILRSTYGANAENYISHQGVSNLAGQIHGRYLSQQAGGDKKGMRSHGYLNVGRDLQKNDLNAMGQSGFHQSGFMNSPYSLAQKHQQKQQKWQDILKNKEGILQSRHKKMKD